MAYTNLYNGYWTSGDPLIPLTISYVHGRSGADMLYNVRVSIGAVTGERYYGYPIYCTVTADGTTIVSGQQIKPTSPSQWSTPYRYNTGIFTVANKLSGTTALTVRVYAGGGSSRDATYSYGMDVDVNLSTLSTTSDVFIGQTTYFTITSADPDYEHSITFIGNGVEEQILAQGSSLSASWTIGAAWYDQIPTSQTLAGVYRLTCYLDGEPVGYSDKPVTLHVQPSDAPSITSLTVSPVNTNAFFTAHSLYIVGHTQARVQTAYTLSRAASLEDISISLASGVQTGSGDDWTSAPIYSAGSKSVDVVVTDSRGMTDTDSTSFTALEYAAPSLSGLTYARGSYVGGVWTDNAAAGQDLKITFTANLTLTAQGNTGTLVTKANGTTIDTRTLSSGTNAMTIYKTSFGDTAGTISVSLTDDVGNTATASATVTGVAVPFNINTHLPGFGMGKMAETAKTLEVANDWDIVRNGQSAFGSSGPVDLTTDVTGILPLANGGSGSATWEDISGEIQFAKTSGNSTLADKGAYRWGKVVQIHLSFTTSASISAGTSIWVGTMTGHLPSRVVQGATFSNNSGAQTQICRISASGGIRVQEVVGSAASGSTITFGFTYIEA